MSAELSEGTRAEFLERNAPRRLLVNSIAKSGTTWVRTMLAHLPGYSAFPMEGLGGAANDAQEELLGVEPGYIFHGHAPASERLLEILEERNFSVVFVYRDLRDLVVSNYFHLACLNPNRAPDFFKGKDKEELFKSENLPQWCGPVNRYHEVGEWLKQGNIPTTTYEALTRDTAGEMKKLLDRWGLWNNAELIGYIVQMGSFKSVSGREPGEEKKNSPQRKGIVGDWKNHFSDENRRDFKKAFGHYLIDYGFEKDDHW